MKRIAKVFLISLITLSAGVLTAQPNAGERPAPTPGQRAEMMTERMTQELGLNDQQKAQVYDLNLEMAAGMPQRGERQHNRDGMKARMEQHNLRLQEILTPEQFEKWSARMERPGHRDGQRGNAHHARHKGKKQKSSGDGCCTHNGEDTCASRQQAS